MELNFVIPGWYKSKFTTGDVIQTIRVLGGGDKSPNHFKLMDNREMHENEILDNWEFMQTAMDEHGPPQENFNLGNIDKDIDENNYQTEIVIEPEEIFVDLKQEPNHILLNQENNRQYIQPNIYEKNPEEIFVDQLLKKLSSEQQIETKNEIQFKSTFDIPIKFTFNYDLNKLKKILNLIDIETINLDMFISKIISNDLNDINLKINESIKEFLLKNEEIKINQQPIEIFSENKKKEIEPKLINTHNYLNNL